MTPMNKSVESQKDSGIVNKIIFYTSIAYSITWIVAFGIYLLFKKGDLTNYQLNLYHSFAAIGPTIAALITTYSLFRLLRFLDLDS